VFASESHQVFVVKFVVLEEGDGGDGGFDVPGIGLFALFVAVESEALTETFSVIGRKGLPAEKVAQQAAQQVDDYLDSGAPVGPHLADQLLLPMALTGGGVYRTSRVTSHTETQMALIPAFLPVEFDVSEGEQAAAIRVDV